VTSAPAIGVILCILISTELIQTYSSMMTGAHMFLDHHGRPTLAPSIALKSTYEQVES
jgi:hypothetical protein